MLECSPVSTASRQAIAEQGHVEVPLFTPLDVARYLRAPVWVVLAMLRRWGPPHLEEFFHWFGQRFPPFGLADGISGQPELDERLSFRRFADLYVRHFAAQSLVELGQRGPREEGRANALGEAAWRALVDRAPGPVIFGPACPEEGVAPLLRSYGDRLNEEERRWLEKRFLLCLGRVEMEEGAPCRLYPFSRAPAEGSPRTIVMDPRIRFGRPTVTGRGTPTDVLFERHQAGDSLADLANDYGLEASQLEEVIRFEAMPPSLGLPFFGW